ncbi:multidrug efflux pump subunit AcrB [Arcticibacter tournemirensis]|uniref:Efflux RND transporter permease subunit n=1 Tax=Arcticibacter tournemirensis TaxID=699437 RepID=A0A5M9H5W5_9SPHI|nr:efflux RND transporter permease subunit [Arcticibacter tournemirensis]KAA8481535.1 efflux RND transporter permease subunit [Arcticibacter tournemirensis]TQM49079.1 multidrug efflux pump subunit AcrB [Arcticibacter tournemirensis]
MDISKYAVKNYQFTLIMVLMVVAVGISTLLTMPRAEDPDMKTPQFPVVIIYPGTSPKDMEQLVVKPLESKLYGLDNIKRIKTNVLNGLAVINVEYRHGSNVEDKYQELIREIGALRSQLPQDIYSIDVQKVEPSGVNVLQIALISENASRGKMKKFSEDLQDELEKISSLKDVRIHGLPQQLIRIDVQPDRLEQLHIPLATVMQAVQSEAGNIPGGSIIAGGKSFSVKTSGNYQSIEQIKNTIISSNAGKNILLRDVGNVYPDYAPETHMTRLNSHRCLFVTAAQKEGENISATQEMYLPVIEKFKTTLPANIDLVVNFDQADNVNHRLKGLGIDFAIAVFLVLITLLPLGSRASLVVMIAIPLSLSIGVVLVHLAGFSLNQLSIVGFVVALGLLVDDSIVVIENIERWMREGHSRLEAALKATKQIAMAVVGCTATLVIAFMPLMFMPEASGDFIRSLPTAVISSVLASMLIALTVVPFLASRMLKPHANPAGNVVLRAFQKVIHGTYSVLLDKALKKPWHTIVIAVVIFGASLSLIPVIGFSLFPSSEKPQFLIDITAPLQSNIYYTDSITRQIERKLKSMPEVKYYSSNVGKGNPRIYYNVIQQNEKSDLAEIFVQLRPDTRADRKTEIIAELRKAWTPYPGAKIEVKDFEQGIPMISPVEVRLLGDNLDTLRNLASRVEALLKNTEGAIYVNNPVRNNKTDIRVDINRQKALALGVPAVNVDRTVRMALAGIDLGVFSDPATDNDDYLLRMSIPRPSYPDLSVFDGIYVNNVKGGAVPLNQLATLRLESSPSNINHINKERTVSVNSFVQKGYQNDRVIQDVISKMDQMTFPAGYHYQMGGEVETTQESFGGFGTIVLITVFLFIAVLVLEFKTFKSTLIVLSVIPLGIVGAVLALLVTGNTLSFVATVGIVALAGIEVKNTILLVDFTNQLRRDGMPLNDAIEKAGEIRFLPIILTSLTAIGGLLPIAWSSNPLISPLAIVMIGGLISSTLLSRVVTPVVYKLMPPVIKHPH